MLLGPIPPDTFKGDGCTWAPDSWGAVYFGEACRCHDFHYRTRCISRWKADWRFWSNLIRLGCPRRLAFVYWLGVRFGGRYSYYS